MNTHHNESNFNLSIDDNFQNSEIFPFFGITNVESKEYTCTISFVVSSSEDIEVDKVIDFIKDFIPAQLEEFDSSKHLETFKKVNDKVSEVLAETLEGDSFIDVSISYVLIKNNYFYVSLDEGFNLIIFRNGKEHKIRKTNISPLSGSGLLENEDNILLTYYDNSVLNWISENTLEEEIPNVNVLEEFNNLQNLNNDKVTKLPRLDDEDIQYNSPSITKHASVLQTRDEDSDLDDSNDEVNEGHEISARLSQNTIDKYENELEDENEEEEDMKYKNIQNIDNNIHEDNETDEESEETGIEITEDSNRKSSLKDKASDFKDKSLPIFKIIINKVKIYLFSAIRNLGEAFSYIFSLIFRQGKKGGLSKALPNKRKGFLILSLIIFLVILLGLFIKSTNEENAKKQLEQSYKDKVAMVGTDISTVKNQYSTKVVIGDPDLKTKIVVLQDEVKNVEGSSLKDKLNEQTTIAGFYKTLADLQDRVDGIIRVGEEIKLAKYSGIIPNFAPSSITMRDGKIYFTDTANSTVSQFDTQTNNTNQIITKSASISNPISIDFAKNQLLLLDTQKGVSSIDVNAKTLIHIPGYDQVAPNATTLKTYYDKDTDNFYMLEPAKKQIDRMVSIGSGRYSSITKYNKDDLGDNLQDFSIIGGSAYTIDSTGLVKKYTRSDSRGAVQDTFSLPPLTIPIGMGAKIAGMIPRDQGNVYLFIADPANGRLLVFDNKDPQNGDKFLGQYMISTNSSAEFQDVFKNIKGIVVDDTSSVPAVYMILNYGLVKLNITIQ